MTTPSLAEVIAPPDYGVISRSIADTIAQVTKPLTNTQRTLLAASLGVWCEKLIAEARTSAASLRDEDVWISVKDRLPDENVPVWCCSDSLHPFIGGYVYVDNEGYAWTNCYRSFYFHDGKWKADDFEWDDQYDVTHWQPLPTPPTQPAAQERQA